MLPEIIVAAAGLCNCKPSAPPPQACSTGAGGSLNLLYRLFPAPSQAAR
jgi:hypothetical protein